MLILYVFAVLLWLQINWQLLVSNISYYTFCYQKVETPTENNKNVYTLTKKCMTSVAYWWAVIHKLVSQVALICTSSIVHILYFYHNEHESVSISRIHTISHCKHKSKNVILDIFCSDFCFIWIFASKTCEFETFITTTYLAITIWN